MKKHLLVAAIAAIGATGVYAQSADTLANIKQRGVVNLGVRDSSGLAFTLGGGKYVGFHTEMAERIVDDLGKQLGKPLKINYQVITSQNRVPLIQNGTGAGRNVAPPSTSTRCRARTLPIASCCSSRVVRMPL